MVYSHLYHGEVFDARMLQAGWDEAGFGGATAAHGWGPVELYKSSTKYEVSRAMIACIWVAFFQECQQ